MKPTMIVSLLAVLGAPAAHALAQVVNPHAAIQMDSFASVVTPEGSNYDNPNRNEPNVTASWGGVIGAVAFVPGNTTGASCLVQQELTFEPYYIRSYGSSFADVVADPVSSAEARGDSRVTVTFLLDAPHRVEWGGYVLAHNEARAQVYFDTIPPSPTGIFVYDATNNEINFGQPSVVLPAGAYRFVAILSSAAQVSGGGAAAPAEWEVRLIFSHVPTPCPGDANGDSMVNFTDITAILANFGHIDATGLGVGDSNHDGVVNFADVTETLVRFNQPCD